MSQRLPEFSLVATHDWSRLLGGHPLKRRRPSPRFVFAELSASSVKSDEGSTVHPAHMEREPIVISGHDFGRFVDSISAPAEPALAHLALVRRRRRAGR